MSGTQCRACHTWATVRSTQRHPRAHPSERTRRAFSYSRTGELSDSARSDLIRGSVMVRSEMPLQEAGPLPKAAAAVAKRAARSPPETSEEAPQVQVPADALSNRVCGPPSTLHLPSCVGRERPGGRKRRRDPTDPQRQHDPTADAGHQQKLASCSSSRRTPAAGQQTMELAR